MKDYELFKLGYHPLMTCEIMGEDFFSDTRRIVIGSKMEIKAALPVEYEADAFFDQFKQEGGQKFILDIYSARALMNFTGKYDIKLYAFFTDIYYLIRDKRLKAVKVLPKDLYKLPTY